ncbi:MAG: hypothetical protein IJ608_14540 [Lachnospiraceae bacterium]|nr:hypothetical protein [Lachnospiraceae bacterium]
MKGEVNEMNIEKLREEVNPVYSTAHSCLQLVAAAGDEDSENLRKVLGFTRFGEDRKQRGAKVPPQILEALLKAIPVFNSQIEARFFSSKLPEEIATAVGHIAAGAVSKTTLANNVFFDADIEKALVLSDTLKATVNKKSSEVNKPATASKPATSKNPVEKKTEVKKVAGKKK